MVFMVALIGYVLFFFGDSFLRTRKGPWEVTFFSTNSSPAIRITQHNLGIQEVTVVFEGEVATQTNSQTLSFKRPKQRLPFGRTKFEDLTYLPGSVAFDFFGHEVELLPRTLYLNKVEHAWTSGEVLVLKPAQKLPPEKFYDPVAEKRRFKKK